MINNSKTKDANDLNKIIDNKNLTKIKLIQIQKKMKIITKI